MVVETSGPQTYVGRFDSEDDAGVHLLDVGVHESGGNESKDEYVRRSAQFGIRVERKHLIVPRQEVARIAKLGEIAG